MKAARMSVCTQGTPKLKLELGEDVFLKTRNLLYGGY